MSEICTRLINPTQSGMFCVPTRECLDKLIKGHTQITEASYVYFFLNCQIGQSVSIL